MGARVHWMGLALALALATWGCDDEAAAGGSQRVPAADMGPAAPDAAPPPACNPAEILGGACDEPTWAPTTAWVVAEMKFAVEDEDGRVWGFDLDGAATERGDDTGCGHRDYLTPEGDEGIDSQLSTVWPLIENVTGDAVDGLMQGAINEGSLLITLAVSGDDERSGFAYAKAAGVPLLGTDGIMLPHQTYGIDPAATPSMATGGWVSPDRYQGGGVDVVLPIDIFTFQLDLVIQDARLDFTRQPDGSVVGYMGGSLSVGDFMGALDQAAIPQNLKDFVRTLLFQRADMAPNADGECQALSAVLEFRAVPSYVADWDVEVGAGDD